MSQPFLLGINYWPRRKAMYWWSAFEAGEVREEFAIIRDLGLQIVRIFLLWDDFQPAPDQVAPKALDHLNTVCDIAAEYQLKLDVTFFTGHMSGPNWSPGWLLDDSGSAPSPACKQLVSGGRIVPMSYRNMYTDSMALDASRLLLKTVVTTFKDHPAIWMWNLGNEPDLFAWPPDSNAGRSWIREMTKLIRAIDTTRPVTYGLHAASLTQNNGFRVDQVYAETDVAVMHAYPMYSPVARQPLDPDFVPYTCALTSALCGKPTLMEEFGGCTALPGKESHIIEWTAYGQPRTQFMASEQDLAAYFEAVLPRLVAAGSTGAMLWCFADYVPELWDKPPCLESRHERYFGVVHPDGSLKPHAEVIREFAAANPQVQDRPASAIKLDLSPDAYYAAPEAHFERLYREYLAAR